MPFMMLVQGDGASRSVPDWESRHLAGGGLTGKAAVPAADGINAERVPLRRIYVIGEFHLSRKYYINNAKI